MIVVTQLELWQRLLLALAVGLFATAVLFAVFYLPIVVVAVRRRYSSQSSGM